MASRYDGRGEAPTITRRRHVLACARCRARRVKCDRGQPACSNCVKVGALCQPVQQSPAQHPSLPSRPGSGEPVDHNRLYKLEEQVARLSREVDSRSPSREPSRSPPPHQDSDGHLPTRSAGIVRGAGSTYLSPYSWAAAAKEIVQLEALLADATMENTSRAASNTFHGDILSMVDEGMHESLLRVYAQRVDPLIRLLHWPTFVEKARSFRERTLVRMRASASPNYGAVYGEPTTAASFASSTAGLPQRGLSTKDAVTLSDTESNSGTLLYSVYFAALTSVQHGPHPPELSSSTDCIALWANLKKDLSRRIGLLSGHYVQTESVDMLQAMVLFMSMEIGAADPKAQWLQLGTAIRTAQSLGVHRDPADFGLDVIEIETRRRLWAQICILDARLAEYLCREPSIVPASYDTILPLSISDLDLVEIHQQQATHAPEHETYLQVLRNIEKAQEHTSPFTSMTFMLIEAEMARQQQQLQCSNYQPRDLTSSLRNPPQTAKGRNTSSGHAGRTQSANGLRTLLTLRYNWDRLDGSDPLQYLISELCQINMMKVKFITRSPRGPIATSPTSVPNEHAEILSIFHDALQLATRCAALTQQYSGSPYNWYTRRLREVHSSSFLAALLVSRHSLSPEDTNSAWAILDQLFPSDTAGNLLDTELRDTLLGRILEKARAKRGLQVRPPAAQQIRPPAMHSSTTHYPSQVLPNMPTVSSTAVGIGSGFQPSGNLFEDWDALMQEPVWSSGIPVTESNYWSNAQTSSSGLDTPSRSQPRRYNHRLYAHEDPYQNQNLPTPPTIPSQYRPHPQRQLPIIDISSASRRNDSSSPYGTSAAVLGAGNHWSPSPVPSTPAYSQPYMGGQGQDDFVTSPRLAESGTWPLPITDQLQVPRGTGRERSNSQPTYSNVSRSPSDSVVKRRSASNLGERPEDFQHGLR